MSTHTHIAGAVTPHLFIMHNHPGISAPHQLKMSFCVRTQQRIGIQKLLRLVAMEIGSITILTGLSLVIVIGALHFLFGDVKTSMRSVSNH